MYTQELQHMSHERDNGNLNIPSHFMDGKTDSRNMMQLDQININGQGEKCNNTLELLIPK